MKIFEEIIKMANAEKFEKIWKILGPLTMKGEFGKNVLYSSSPLPFLGKGLSF
jgi:hypothetical protein